jgi:succinate dehydrogenase/fumarate reductase flavoprotein subunit
MNGARKVLVVALVLSFAVALFFPTPPSRSSKQRIAIMTASLENDDSQKRIVVIGGGLAGLCAAYEAARTSEAASSRVHVLLLEKNDRVGGNSAKASSGINSVNPNAGDSASLFEQDTLKSGRGRSDAALVQALVAGAHGGPGGLVEFFSELGVDLPSVARLGGHSAARTRTTAPGSGVNVGLALVRAVEAALVRRHPRVSVVTGARVTRVERSGSGDDDAGRLLVTYEFSKGDSGGGSGGALNARPQAVLVAADALIIATGGFAASRELLARYAPPGVADLATTNGPWATGDGLALGTALGGVLRGMADVQVRALVCLCVLYFRMVWARLCMVVHDFVVC